MCGKHQKAISSPSTFPVERKRRSWVIKPSPGGYPKDDCIPLGVIIREVLGYAETMKEVRSILHKGLCKVDGKVVKDPGLPLGVFSVLALDDRFFRLVPSKGGFKLLKIEAEEANKKLCRIEDKTMVKGNKLQLNLNDGKNIEVEPEFGAGTGTGVLLDLKNMKITETVEQKAGIKVMLVRGKNRGKICELKESKEVFGSGENRVLVETEAGEVLDLPKSLIFPIGKKQNLIEVE